MLFLLCVLIGCATGFGVGLFVYKRFPLWPQVAAATAGAMVGSFVWQMLDRSQGAGVLQLLSALFGAVAALALASSLRQPMGVD